MKRTCSFYGCDAAAKYVETDRFNVAGIDSVAFYDVCDSHLRPADSKPAPGHEPIDIRTIE